MIRVMVAEDMRVLRDTLVAVLNLEDDMEVVAEVATGDRIVPDALAQQPDVALLDIDLPVTDGLTAAAEMREKVPDCKVLILTGLGRPEHMRQAVAVQVSGFMNKDSPADELVDAVRQVAGGGSVFDPKSAVAALASDECPLSVREIEVLKHYADGAAAAEIAASLYLSQGTVRNYLAAAVTKLDARNRVDAARIAREAGWL